ncbi:MAG: glycosyltransferase N-terminal domain-containing protein [Pseudomonadota bacterium]
MSYAIYKLLSSLLFVIVFPFFYLYSFLTGNHKESLNERCGVYGNIVTSNDHFPRIWIHAASVGEIRAAQALLPELQKCFPNAVFFLSTMTRHGYHVAKAQLPSSVACIFAPLDVCWLVRRALTKLRPTCYICLETELWPNFLTEARRSGINLFLLNGRLSDKSLRRYKKLPGLIPPLVDAFSAIATISEIDKNRFIELGAHPGKVLTTGNAKFDLCDQTDTGTARSYKIKLELHDTQQVVIFGSTHSGEENFVIEALLSLQAALPEPVFILAPRHLNRLVEIENLFSSHSITYDKLSELSGRRRQHSVVLVDTMGELAALYSIGTFIFCGGSMVPKGGHNIMEAAIWGKPVYYGPHMKDFADAAELLESHSASIPIAETNDFIESVLFLSKHPEQYASLCENARHAAVSQQGASYRQARLVAESLHTA